MNTPLLVVAIAIAAAGFGCLYWRRTNLTEVALMAAIETSRAADVGKLAPGTLVEVKGAIRSDEPLIGQFSGRACVHVRSLIERVETRRDNNQQQQTQYIPESDVTETIPFEVEDDSGRVRVDPKGARIEPKDVYTDMRRSLADDVVSLATSFTGGGGNAHRYKEWILPLDHAVYVLGTVQADGSIGAAPADAKLRTFIVTHETEEERTASTRWWSEALLWIAAALFAGALAVLYRSFGSGWTATG